jgi:tetratricopeptide (TPR) repeat protein
VSDSPRIQELRRRVQQDPASLAFAPLAEELRRAGRAQEAVSVCQAGLALHPEYLSARATLGRALLELGHVDEALLELTTVLNAAPENLTALRGVADVHHRRGEPERALEMYRRAQASAPQDADLERVIGELQQTLPSPEPPRGIVNAAPPPATSMAADPAFEEQRGQLRRLQQFLDMILADRARRAAARA